VLSSVADVLIISTLATFGIAMAPLPIAIIATEFGAAVAFGAILDVVKIPVFARLRIFSTTRVYQQSTGIRQTALKGLA
jgi:H+-transporting ATPase